MPDFEFAPTVYIPDAADWRYIGPLVADLYEDQIGGVLVRELSMSAITGVILECDQVVAAVSVDPNVHDAAGCYASLERVAVHTEYHRQGLGRRLVAFAAHLAVSHGDITMLAQVVSDDGHKLLGALGFEQNGDYRDIKDQALRDLAASYGPLPRR